MVSDPGHTSRSLLERAKARCPDAWERLVRIYGPLVYGWARNAGLRGDDASDVAQEVFVTLVENLSRFRKEEPGDSFRGWLWRVTRNKVHDHFRSQQKSPGGGSLDLAWQLASDSPVPEESAAGRDELGNLRIRALLEFRELFEPHVWESFWRVAVLDQSPRDVASDLKVTVWAVYKSKARVLGRLRQELEGLPLLNPF